MLMFALPIIVLCLLTRRSSAVNTTIIEWGKDFLENEGLEYGDVLETNVYTGDKVTWIWTDSSPHGIRSSDNKFTSSVTVAEKGYNYTVQFLNTGTFPYECSIFPEMKGEIIVVTSPGLPTTSPTSFSTAEPDLSTTFSQPRSIDSKKVLPGQWTLELEVRWKRIYVTDTLSFNTRCFCYLTDCRLVGPTIKVKAGDMLTLEIKNSLGPNNVPDKQPNTTRFYIHGLHIDPQSTFLGIDPGETKEVTINIPADHATGVHWYSSNTDGMSELHTMSGLVGAIYVDPQIIDDVPFAIQNAGEFMMVVTKVILKQECDSFDEVTQGCGPDAACDPISQYPLCNASSSKSLYNPYRLYSLQELNKEANSSVNIDVETNGTLEDLTLINGQLRPTVNIVNKQPSIFKIVNAGTGSPLHIELPSADISCSGGVIAVDGVYLQARWDRSTFDLPAGSRIDLEIFCDFTGIYTVYESGQAFFNIRVSQSSANRPPVKGYQLALIRRPSYLPDLTEENASTIDRYFSVDMSLRQVNPCSFQLGYGMNCSNGTAKQDANSTYSQYNDDCQYDVWSGSHGNNPFDYVFSNRFVTFVEAINQWTVYGERTGYQTLSMKINHFQIIAVGGNKTLIGPWFQVGQYRDTLPLVVDNIIIRFVTSDYVGENIFQSNFLRHKDLGVQDSFYIVNYSTFQSLTEFPTMAPTETPDDGIIQRLDFQMAVIFLGMVILGAIALAFYYAFFTESRSTVFPDKIT